MRRHSTREIVLDESKANATETGFTEVGSELDFLRHEGLGTEKLWISGDLCKWVRRLYRVRDGHGVDIRDLESPDVALRRRYGFDAARLERGFFAELMGVLSERDFEQLAHLMRYLTSDEMWCEDVSAGHAARWLIAEIDERLAPLAEVQQEVWRKAAGDPELQQIYGCGLAGRAACVELWLFDGGLQRALGAFPVKLPERYRQFVKMETARRLRASDGEAVLDLPRESVNRAAYSEALIEYFKYNPDRLRSKHLSHVNLLLDAEQRAVLQRLLAISSVEPLPTGADHAEALAWATEKYLPFRETELGSTAHGKGDELGESFARWLLSTYPSLTSFEASVSPINIRTHHLVKELSEKHWVLWVVVDGLNYLHHKKLLKLLGEHSQLRVASDDVVLAALPTITKRAKFCLTTGKYASQALIIDEDTKKHFLESFPGGVYSGETGIEKLVEGLRRPEPTVCYWNFTKIDKIFHSNTDLVAALNEAESVLQSLAKNIDSLIGRSSNPDRVAVVVCSDHGQMLRRCRKLEVDSEQVSFAHGRTLFGYVDETWRGSGEESVISEDGEIAFLNPKSFRLFEPTSVALKSAYFVDWGNNGETAIGVHGGLFPEETVLGLSVLGIRPERHPVAVTIRGNGESGKPGTVTIEIDNPNTTAIMVLSLIIAGINIADHSGLLGARVPAQRRQLFEVPVELFPDGQANGEFAIAGELNYEFEDGVPETSAVSGKLICKTLYSTKNPSLNRFRK